MDPMGSLYSFRFLQGQKYFNNNSKILFVFFTLTFVLFILKQQMLKWLDAEHESTKMVPNCTSGHHCILHCYVLEEKQARSTLECS